MCNKKLNLPEAQTTQLASFGLPLHAASRCRKVGSLIIKKNIWALKNIPQAETMLV